MSRTEGISGAPAVGLCELALSHPRSSMSTNGTPIQYAGYKSANPIRASYQLVAGYQLDCADFDQPKRTDAHPWSLRDDHPKGDQGSGTYDRGLFSFLRRA